MEQKKRSEQKGYQKSKSKKKKIAFPPVFLEDLLDEGTKAKLLALKKHTSK